MKHSVLLGAIRLLLFPFRPMRLRLLVDWIHFWRFCKHLCLDAIRWLVFFYVYADDPHLFLQSTFATGLPLTCKLCPSTFLPDDGHDMCPSCLGIQHLKKALTDPCLHCRLLPMSERLLRLVELDPNSAVGLGDADFQSTTHTRKRGASAAAVAPHSKKKAPSRKDHMEETSLSKTVAVLSSEMSELKRLLQTLQPVVPISPATVSQEDEERSSRRKEEEPLSSSSPSRHTEYDVLSTNASDSFFQEHLKVCVQSFPQDTQTVLSKAEGSSEDSVH